MIPAVSFTPPDLVTRAGFHPVALAFVLVSSAWYLISVRRLRRGGGAWAPYRSASFFWAEVLLVVALISGMTGWDRTVFTVYAVQHIMVGMVAPVLFAISAPLTLALSAGGPRVRATLLRVLRSRAAALVLHPALLWVIFSAYLFVLYFTGLFAATLRNPSIFDLAFLGLLVTGFFFYAPVVAIDPLPRRYGYGIRIAYFILSLPLYTILGMALESQNKVMVSRIALSDLHMGGAVVWIFGEGVGLCGGIYAFVQWLRADERAAKHADRQSSAAAEAQLAHWRASRDAAAQAFADLPDSAR